MNTATTIPNQDATVLYLPGAQAAVLPTGGTTPTAPREKDNPALVLGKIVPWGESNDFPQQLMELGSKNTIIAQTMEKKVAFLYGKGIQPYYLEGYNEMGEEILKPVPLDKEAEVWEFLRRSNISRYLMEAAMDLYWFHNPFPEMILSKNRKKIVQLVAQEATDCRWEVMGNDGIVKHCYINANWPDMDEKLITKVKAIDPYHPYRWELLQEDNGYKYIYPLSYPTPGKKYYQLAPWYSAEQSGWLAVAQAIPQWKKALMQNQITVKYIIKVPDYWWEWKYANWKSMKPEEKVKAQQTEYEKVEKFLAGAEQAGKTFMTTFKWDPTQNRELPGWEITPVDNKWKDGMYIEDSQEASAHLLYALGVDPTLVGFSPGKNHTSAGSGSDKRVAYNMYVESLEPHRDLLLEPLYFIGVYNGWPSNLKWKFRYTQISTLQNGTETKTEMQ